ncbi:hypothetical protein [Mycobacterium sp. 155]|uniref:hypothetical protein n=1 Tax=Mycobacterium sp. 155 TaxID=1157943 RepID=UPI000379C5E8|nr:hypothetical protein [Mycobacterium sp. 155]
MRLCAALVRALGPRAVLVGMDAFHLSNKELLRLQRRDRKGAPDTFDVAGYVSLLRRVLWYLDLPEEIRKDRLIKRHFHFGKSIAEARSWTEQVDLQNAAVTEETRHRADLVVEVPDDPDAGLRLS